MTAIEHNKIHFFFININKDEYQKITNNLDGIFQNNSKKEFTTIGKAIDSMKKIKFEEVLVLMNEGIEKEFIDLLKANLKYIYTIPKIFIVTNGENKEIVKDFYCFGKMNASQLNIYFLELINNRKKIIKEKEQKKIKKENNEKKFSFVYNKLINLENIYKSLMEKISNEKIKEFNDFLCNTFFDNYDGTMNKFLFLIYDIKNIPIELLSKFYISFYCSCDDFCNDMKNELFTKSGLDSSYLPLIKVLYNSLKLGVYDFSTAEKIYSGQKFEDYEIEIIQKKLEDGQNIKVYSKRFLSFTDDALYAKKHKDDYHYNTIITLENKCKNLNDKLPTFCNTFKNLSKLDGEREILFFPFSAFEIVDLKYNESEKQYEMKLLYNDSFN